MPIDSRQVSWILLDRARDVAGSWLELTKTDIAHAADAFAFDVLRTDLTNGLGRETLRPLAGTLRQWTADYPPPTLPMPSTPRATTAGRIPPPLLPGEVFTTTDEGCGLIFDASDGSSAGRDAYAAYLHTKG